MTLLVISPDYASHLFPLATLATAWRDAGERVVVATGPATDALVRAFGFERVPLQLGRGSNPGVIRAEEQPAGEDESLGGFFAATRAGAVETLAFQAAARGDDLLWDPLAVARAVQRIVADVRPDQVLVDHLAFSARLALKAAGVRHADVVLGHPTALTVGDEVYGYPPAWPACFHPDPVGLAALHDECVRVRDAFTARWNEVLATLDPTAVPSADAFAEAGDVLLLNYPAALHDPARTRLLPRHAFLGSAVRTEPPDAEVEAWLAASGAAPLVYVSFGSFLSVRGDVLAVVVDALRGLDVRVALAHGSSPRGALGPLPEGWLVREVLPQVTLLRHAALQITHGGNNSVTEALTAGVPLLVLPFSTDQFAGAAALERAGFAEVLDPNAAGMADVRDAAVRLLALAGEPRERLDRLAQDLRAHPGPERARAALAGSAAALVARLDSELRARAVPERAAGEKAYLKSDLEHYGTSMPAMRAAVRASLAGVTLDHDALVALVEELWAAPVHERRAAAVEVLEQHAALLGVADAGLLERLLRESRTWALVDGLAASVVGPLTEEDPAWAPRLDAWAADPDFWLRRSALLAHLLPLRTGGGDWGRFTRFADAMLPEKEFFIRKAIGWVLRDTARRRPDLVFDWLLPRAARASGVTLREAVKPLTPAQRDAVLAAR